MVRKLNNFAIQAFMGKVSSLKMESFKVLKELPISMNIIKLSGSGQSAAADPGLGGGGGQGGHGPLQPSLGIPFFTFGNK